MAEGIITKEDIVRIKNFRSNSGISSNNPWIVLARNYSSFDPGFTYAGDIINGGRFSYIGYKNSDTHGAFIVFGYFLDITRVSINNGTWAYKTLSGNSVTFTP